MESCCTCHISSSNYVAKSSSSSNDKENQKPPKRSLFRTGSFKPSKRKPNPKEETEEYYEYYEYYGDDDDYDYDSGDYRRKPSPEDKVRKLERKCRDKKWNIKNELVFDMLEMFYEEDKDC